MEKLPFSEHFKEGSYLRTFSSDLSEEDLKWHWDQEDRIVVCEHDTNWMFQRDNELPHRFEKDTYIFIPEGQYHRIIKGEGDLTLKVKKIIK